MTAAAACQGLDEEAKNEGNASPDAALGVATITDLQVVSTDEASVPTFANGNFGRLHVSEDERTEKAEEIALRPTIAALRSMFRVNPDELAFQYAFTDNIGDRHFVYGQHKNGLEVLGGALVLHTRNDVVYAVHGGARADLDAPPDAEIDAEAAVTLAKKDSSAFSQVEAEAIPRMAYRPAGDKLDLVYMVKVTGIQSNGMPVDDDVIVNAVNGSVVERLPHIHTVKNREVHSLNHGTTLPGPIVRIEGGPPVADPVVNTNYNWLGTTYDCYKNLFNRDSYNNAGAKLISSIHYGTGYVNAFWNGTQMVYGDGDGVTASNLANSMDVTAHELTHAVTSSSSNLTYSGESGGLNESMSDIFGNVCEWYRDGQVVSANTWKVGEDVWTPATAGDALRYMNDPAKDGQSLDFWTSSAGSVDVHYSSGISNLAFYLLSQGGTHPRGKSATNVSGIGIAKAAQIFYRANTVTLLGKPNATFAQARTATEQAAAQLGYSAADIASVAAAWMAVGVGTGSYVPVPADYDGDGKTDLSGKDANGFWYIDYASNGFGAWDVIFTGYGDATAVPVPADYDGDGKADLSVKNASGAWYINYASNGFDSGWDWFTTGYGDATAVPVPADYDGDGKADLSVKNASGTWYINYASNGFASGWDAIYTGYGNATAVPVPADYDGDGKADLSVKDATGFWGINYASNGFASGWDSLGTGYGDATAVPVPADYDGDGKADLSVKNAGGAWYINYASNGFDSGWDALYTGYGDATAVPVPADYDGDGKADLSGKNVTGTWYINYASNGFASGWDLIVPLTM